MKRIATIALLALLMPMSLAAQEKTQNNRIERLELKATSTNDALRLIAEMSDLNLAATEEAGKKKITLFLKKVSPRKAVEHLCRTAGLWFRVDDEDGTIHVMTTEEYRSGLVLYSEPRTSVHTLLYPNVVAIATAIEDLYGDRVEMSLGADQDDLYQNASGVGAGGDSYLSGRSRFSRDVNTADRRRSRHYDDRNYDRRSGDNESDLLKKKLSVQQIAELEKRLKSMEAAGKTDGITSETLKGLSQELATIYITVNRMHNLIAVRTSDSEAMKNIEKLIIQMDRPTPQVLLEMKILELEIGDEFRSVFDIDFLNGPLQTGPNTDQPRNPLQGGQGFAARSIMGLGNFALEGGTLLYQYMNDNVRVRIQMYEEENKLVSLGSPLLLCANQRAARIFVGEERPLVRNYDVETDITQGVISERIIPDIEVRNIGNTLYITPSINADRSVTLTILQDTSTVNPGGATIPIPLSNGQIQNLPIDTVNTANLEGTVVARDGMTLAIGGLIREQDGVNIQKVPLLGNLPVLGFFFKREVRTKSRREIILLITPYIITTPAEGMEVTRARLREISQHPAAKEKDFPEKQTPDWAKKFLQPLSEDNE